MVESTRVVLDHGMWFELKHPWELTQADSDDMKFGSFDAITGIDIAAVATAVRNAGGKLDPSDPSTWGPIAGLIDKDQLRAMDTMQDAACVGWLKAWGKTDGDPAKAEPLPTIDTIRKVMPMPLFQALEAAVVALASGGHVEFSVDQATDPNSPTVPSSAFNGAGRAKTTRSPAKSPRRTASTATAGTSNRASRTKRT